MALPRRRKWLCPDAAPPGLPLRWARASAGRAVVRRTPARPARTPGLRTPAWEALPPGGSGKRPSTRAEPGWSEERGPATLTRLDALRKAPHGRSRKGRATRDGAMDRCGPAGSPLISDHEPAPPAASSTRDSSPGLPGPGPAGAGGGGGGRSGGGGRPAAANAARERSRVQTLRHAFLELQRTLPSVPPDTKLSKLDVLLLATTYIAHLTRSLQGDAEAPADPGLGALRGDGYLHPVKKWPMRSRLYIGATGQFLKHSVSGEKANHGNIPTDSQP